jgi:hypothetical protein
MSIKPHIPFDVLTIIAHVSVKTYRALLAIPRFGRRSLQLKHQLLHQAQFTTYAITTDSGCTLHNWHLAHRSSCFDVHEAGKYNDYFYHRLNNPALIKYYSNGIKLEEKWYKHNQCHRIDGPAYTFYKPSGYKAVECWVLNGDIHRSNGPAYIEYYPNGQKEEEKWYDSGLIHRLDGPTIIQYYLSGQIKREIWYERGQQHRLDAPALICYHLNGEKERSAWYKYGMNI